DNVNGNRASGKKLVDKEDLIDAVMRYICDSDKNSSLPLFPSSVYAGNITVNSWYTLKNILEEEFVFEVPDGVEVIPLMGYSFSIDGSDTRISPSLHGLSFLECLRLSLGERKVVKFKVTKPQVWFRKTNLQRSDSVSNDTLLENKSKSEKTCTLNDELADYSEYRQNRYYFKDVIYCSTLSGSVAVIDNENKAKLWWNFDSDNDGNWRRNEKKGKNKVLSGILGSAVHLPLSDSLNVGVSKIEQWLLEETTRDPYSWVPYIVPRKVIGDETPISVYDSEDMLLDATILWRCRYLIKSLGRYNLCLMAVANNRFIEGENINSSVNKSDSSLLRMKIYANQIVKRFLDGYITNYTVCFSELVEQLESWRVSHGITSEYCMEMISLFCLNALVTSECLLNYMRNKKKSLVNYNKESELVSGRLFIYYICKILLLRGISMKCLLRYQCNEFSIQHLKTRIQNIGNSGCEAINLRNSISNILEEFETGKLVEGSSKTFITGLHFIDLILNSSEDKDDITEHNEYNCTQVIINEMVMSAILFFAEVKRDITFSRLIGEKYIGLKKDDNFEISNKEISWDVMYGSKYLFELNDFGLDKSDIDNSTIYIQNDFNDVEIDFTSNIWFLRQRLYRVFESIQIKVHIIRVKLNIRFINFLLQKAVDEAREELQGLRRFNTNSNSIGLVLNRCRRADDTGTRVFATCCNSENVNSTYLYTGDSNLDIGVSNVLNYGLANETGNNIAYSTKNSASRNEQTGIQCKSWKKGNDCEYNEEGEVRFNNNNKSQTLSFSGGLYSIASKILGTDDAKFGVVNGMRFQCCNTDKTDFRNLLDLADANIGDAEPPSWTILNSDDNDVVDDSIISGPNYVFSQRGSNKHEELILDWIKLRSWNFTESDLRWIDGCVYLGDGEYEASVLQLSPEMKIEDVAKRILEEVDHSEVRQSLRNISFSRSCPLILVRNYITPCGEILIPSPDISNLIGAVRSCKFN
ncbi:hypothetical protein FG386_002073, partial [Cryptosporidium ryanae]|uniref:uncharacterized protein n=1 Tax=Cryptosporidium ryanae TaxID=515981 RepID=UPI00351A46C8